MDIPDATYRIQFSPEFGFRNAAEIAGYLADLGVSHLYASPVFKALRNSSHGYDGVDPNRLNRQLGGSAEFEKLTKTLRKHAIGWLQDIVPNHMAFDYDNRMLTNVLENGPYSNYYRFFDIDWDHQNRELRGRLLAPFLGKRYWECLINGEIRLTYGEAGITVKYYDLKMPLRIESYPHIFGSRLEILAAQTGENQLDYKCLIDIIDGLDSLALIDDAESRAGRVRDIKQALWRIYCENTAIREFVEENMRLVNGQRGDAASYILLDKILSDQFFRMSYWKVACDEINYRRFFGINGLIALCQEKDEVFDQTHSLLTRLIEDGIVTGIRIDHIDGLADPAGYLKRLRRQFKNLYILVEKILDPFEELSQNWPVQGTTGYEFGAMLNTLFVRQKNEECITNIYTRFSGRQDSFEGVVYDGKRRILESQMAGDLDNLAHRVKRVARRTPKGSDFTLKRLRESLAELLVRFPVYRTYIAHAGPREPDRRYIRSAAELSVLHRPDLQAELLFLQQLLLDELSWEAGDDETDTRASYRQAVTRFQQLTAPLMAKGFEDTALYVYNRLLSLNEVGGDPRRFGCNPSNFHAFVQKRADHWPHAMNSTATHDSKRGEDVRARLNVLSEIPTEWETSLEHWHAANRTHKTRIDGQDVPDKNEEYFLYQTLVGALPIGDNDLPGFIERVRKYMVKAAREAKIHTSWLEPNETYEAALSAFVEKIMTPGDKNVFLDSFLPFCKKIARYGIYNSLSQTLIKMTASGVPDFYQGTELLDLTLVDPDNRRPVDFAERAAVLKKIQVQTRIGARSLIDELLANRFSGRLKIYLITAALNARNEHSRLYREGAYLALQPGGRFHDHVVAFARHCQHQWSITIAVRFLTALVGESEDPLGPGVWQDTVIGLPDGAPSRWHNVFTGEKLAAENTIALGDALSAFPAALLIGG